MEARAVNRFIGSSPRKMRLVIDLIRGESVDKALEVLHFSPKHSSKDAERTLRSAVSNLINKEESARVEPADLFVKEAYVNVGPTLKENIGSATGQGIQDKKEILSFNYYRSKKSIISGGIFGTESESDRIKSRYN